MAEALVFRTEWVDQINAMLWRDESRRPNEDEILRVAAPLRKMKPKAYIPQFVSMGPYHHSKLEKDIDSSCAEHKMISTAETCKGKAAASLSEKLSERGKSFKTIVELMEQMRPEMDGFYHWPTGSGTTEDQEHSQKIKSTPTGSGTTEDQEHSQKIKSTPTGSGTTEDQKHFALMMAVDSAFLLHFLSSLSESSLELGPLQECIKSDILKLENQIPLFVMEKVFENAKEANSIYDGLPSTEKAKEASIYDGDFYKLLQRTCLELSPFQLAPGNNPNEAVKDQQPHLLAYLHAFVSPTLQIERETKTPNLWQRLKFHILDIPLYLFSIFVIPMSFFFERKYEIALHAEKLAKAGIKFKLLSRATEKIRFDSWSGTLYLPEINVCKMHTEVLLRNMVALEFNDVARGTTVMRYIGLMDCLIQTPEDVRVLRRYGVIATDTVTDESIAKMWNDLAQPFFTGQVKPFWQLKFKSKLKSKLKRELYDDVYNWKFIGIVAAILGLFMTAVQTYFTVYPRRI